MFTEFTFQIFLGIAYISTWTILLWGQGVLAFKFMDICYGLATATEIAYYSYLFAMVSEEHYKVITSLTRAAILLGRFVAYLTGQLLVSFDLMDYRQLNIISFVSVCSILILALSFKRPENSEIFHQRKNNREQNEDNNQIEDMNTGSLERTGKPEPGIFKKGLNFLWTELKTAYSNKTIVIWSCFWAFASCGHLQVQNYIQNLWEVITPSDQKGTIYNGAVEALGTLISKCNFAVADGHV